MINLDKLSLLGLFLTGCEKDIRENVEKNRATPTEFRNYYYNSYNLGHTPFWINHDSIPEQNNITT
jgi:hypothetical protein